MKALNFILFFSVFAISVRAQTPYISQNFTAGHFFNPATVGFGSFNKAQVIFRTQFSGVGQPYKTTGIGLDFGFLKNDNTEPNKLGFGLQAISDQVLNGVLQTNYITASIADRVFLNDERSQYLAIGLGTTIISRTVDAQSLIFGDQYYSGRLLNPSSLEVINNFRTKSTLNVGLMYSHNSYTSFFQFGASSYFINRSTGYNTTNDSARVSPLNEFSQVLGQLNYEQIFSGNKTLLVHANYQNRYENEFVYAGAAIGIPFNETYESTNRMYVGCFYRTKDAVVPYIGLLLNKYKFGFTYDIYNNDMTAANLRPQTFEFTLSTYFGKRRNEGMRSLFD